MENRKLDFSNIISKRPLSLCIQVGTLRPDFTSGSDSDSDSDQAAHERPNEIVAGERRLPGWSQRPPRELARMRAWMLKTAEATWGRALC